MRFITDNRVVENKDENSLQVVALGLPRCATSSLQAAFEQDLGLYPCFHMAHVAPHADRLKMTYECLRTLTHANFEKDKEYRRGLLRKLLTGSVASCDFPGMMFVEDIMDMYPDAKIILNQRENGQAWASSITRTLKFFSSKTYYYTCYLWATDRWHHRNHMIAAPFFMERYHAPTLFNPECYEEHNERVRSEARKRGREILEWRATDGWEPLCKFLDKPVPDKPFPHLNDEATIKMLIRILMARGIISWLVVIGVPILGLWLGRSSGKGSGFFDRLSIPKFW
jgi:hypothetical protein